MPSDQRGRSCLASPDCRDRSSRRRARRVPAVIVVALEALAERRGIARAVPDGTNPNAALGEEEAVSDLGIPPTPRINPAVAEVVQARPPRVTEDGRVRRAQEHGELGRGGR